jgi:DNA-binding MarR family transcriptional regulator
MKHQLTLGVRTWLYLGHIMYTVQRRLLAHLETYDLTLSQFGVLAQLQAAPRISQQKLANRMFVTKGNVVGVLNRLENRGLVKRETSLEDSRTNIISLTEQGVAIAAQVVPEHEALVAECMELIDVEDLQTLHHLLQMLDRALRTEP